MLSAVVTAKAQENCGFPGVAPGRVCPVTANPGSTLGGFHLIAFVCLMLKKAALLAAGS